MLHLSPPRRVLMTTDAVGGVWRYAIDLARGLRARGVETVLAGFGPPPDAGQRREAAAAGELRWCDLPLDWMVDDPAALRGVPAAIAALAEATRADLIHLNLPSQAAGLPGGPPVVAVSHSCVVSWFRAVRGREVPADWRWQARLNATGLVRADAVVAPSQSHADLLRRCYGRLPPVAVVANATGPAPRQVAKQRFAYAAARWWDAGKNASVLDAAAAAASWPVLALGAAEGPRGERHAFRHARHLGAVSHAEVGAVAAAAGIFVSPSIYEPFGLAALEAARAGAALVLADIPTYREIWRGAALFAEPRDAAGFAAAIDALAADPRRRAALARRAALRAASLTPDRQAAAMLGIYARLSTPSAAEPAMAR